MTRRETGFVFEQLQPLPETLPEGLYLVLLKTDQIPPHLGLISGNHWFTLTVKGATVAADANRLLQSVVRKNMPVVIVQLAWPRGLHAQAMNEQLEKIFNHYEPLGNNEHTCISPIRDLFVFIYGNEFKTCDFVFEMLQVATEKYLLLTCYQNGHDTGNWVVPVYGMGEVRKAIAGAVLTKAE